MRRRLAAALAVMALLAAACGGDDDDTGTVGGGDTGAAEAQTLPIRVDAKGDPPSSWLHFFPSKVTAHPGDTLQFTAEFTGEPHSVMAGTLIEEALAAEKKARGAGGGPGGEGGGGKEGGGKEGGGEGGGTEGEQHGAGEFRAASAQEQEGGGEGEGGPGGGEGGPPPEVQALLEKIPSPFNEDENAGLNFLNQAGAQPCHAASEDPATKEPCKKKDLPGEFSGKDRFIHTGLMADEDTFEIALADDLKPGTYTFVCGVHGPEMTEEVTVVPEGQKAQTAEEVRAAGQKELDEFLAKVKPAADKVLASTSKDAPGGALLEGPEGEESHNSSINVFPREISVKAGEAVTWTVNGFHTISFNAPEDARPWFVEDASGAINPNPKTFTPANSPQIPSPPPPPGGGGGEGGGGEDGPPPQVKVNGGRYDGTSFLNSGLSIGPVEAQLVYTLAFAKAGTYKYICLIHPDMEGTVKVT